MALRVNLKDISGLMDKGEANRHAHSRNVPAHKVVRDYDTGLLNTVECSVHFHGPSRPPVVNYFSIMTADKHIMTAGKEI